MPFRTPRASRSPRTRRFLSVALPWLLLTCAAPAKNHLAGQKSPHLLDHADNPVDWYPWGEEAFQKARAEQKPIFLSIGYHTCHWCHKMMIESFSDEKTASLLNENFVNIKVDREEFPDIDRIYMAFIQASQGGGGWPLNVWLTPDLVPFSVGTYFSAENIGERASFTKVLLHIIGQWEKFPEYIDSQSKRDFARLQAKLHDLPTTDLTLQISPTDRLLSAYERLSGQFDPENGGFGSSPRFPSPTKLEAIHLILSREGPDSFRARQCLKMITLSLDKMAAGGLHDQLGGGFHRYTTDPAWATPHFEKMLGDQALMLSAYIDGYRLTSDSNYLDVAQGILGYVESTLTSPDGAFYAAQHSDSLPTAGAGQIEEGAYYTWNADDFAAAAGEDAPLLTYLYDVRPNGNSPADAITSDTLSNILRATRTASELAAHFNLPEAEVGAAVDRGKAALLAARARRPAPSIDRQIVTSSNGLMISAYAKAYITIGDPELLARATRALELILDHCYAKDSHTLYHICDPNGNTLGGGAADYAFTIQACLDVYEANFDERWLAFADELQQSQNRQFYDTIKGGFYDTARERSDIVIRTKGFDDGAELAPNPSSILNLIRLGNLLGDEKLLSLADQSIDYFRGAIDQFPTVASRLLLAATMRSESPTQIIIVGKPGRADTDALIATTRELRSPDQIVALLDPDKPSGYLQAHNPQLAKFAPLEGKATAYVCKNFTCRQPAGDPASLRAQLLGH